LAFHRVHRTILILDPLQTSRRAAYQEIRFMAWTQISDYSHPAGWSATDPDAQARQYCSELERGGILYFPNIPFAFPEADRQFLLSQKQSGFRHHKNVSYRPASDVLRGSSNDDPADTKRLQELMRNYSHAVTEFLGRFLKPYVGKWKLDYASFRPLEEQGRDLPVHKRNDLAHVDAFPSRPTNGARILRVFTNINPTAPRIWEVIRPFEKVAQRLAPGAGLDRFAKEAQSPLRPLRRGLSPLLKVVGVPDRSAYDKFMLHFHDYLKENDDFQQKWDKERIEFPPFSTWMVYTDTVPHAVMSGQFALEQTFIMPIDAMVSPQTSPLKVLEGLCGCRLSN
jgi:hypothetical protein